MAGHRKESERAPEESSMIARSHRALGELTARCLAQRASVLEVPRRSLYECVHCLPGGRGFTSDPAAAYIRLYMQSVCHEDVPEPSGAAIGHRILYNFIPRVKGFNVRVDLGGTSATRPVFFRRKNIDARRRARAL